MRNIDANLAAEYAKIQFTHFSFVELYLGSATYRYTDFQHDLYYGGNKYSPRGMKVGNVASNIGLSVDKMTFELDDTDLVLTALLLGEDTRYKRVSLYKGAIDANYEVIAVAEFFRGTIESWELPEPRAKITISNELVKWKDKTLRLSSATCPWVFNAPPYTNLLLNGGFEIAGGGSTFESWIENLGDGTIANEGSVVYEGSHAYKVTAGATANTLIQQDITVSPNKLYKVKTMTRSGDGSASGVWSIIDITNIIWLVGYTSCGITATSYTEFTHVVQAPGGCTTLRLHLCCPGAYGGSGYSGKVAYFDAAALYEVTECAYIGAETWCDQSYARCVALGNQKNFGGMRFIPSMMEKDIWWGKVPS